MFRGQKDVLNGKLLTEGQRSRGQEGKRASYYRFAYANKEIYFRAQRA